MYSAMLYNKRIYKSYCNCKNNINTRQESLYISAFVEQPVLESIFVAASVLGF